MLWVIIMRNQYVNMYQDDLGCKSPIILPNASQNTIEPRCSDGRRASLRRRRRNLGSWEGDTSLIICICICMYISNIYIHIYDHICIKCTTRPWNDGMCIKIPLASCTMSDLAVWCLKYSIFNRVWCRFWNGRKLDKTHSVRCLHRGRVSHPLHLFPEFLCYLHPL